MKTLLLVFLVCLVMGCLIICAHEIGALLTIRKESVRLVQEVQFTATGWCWRGLCLGTDRLDEVERQFRQNAVFHDLVDVQVVPNSLLQWHWKADGHRRGSFNQVPNQGNLSLLIFAMQFDRLMLGESVLLYGVPQVVYVQPAGVANDLVFQVCFERSVCTWVVQSETRLQPSSVMHSIDFFNTPTEQISGATKPDPWRGFTAYRMK